MFEEKIWLNEALQVVIGICGGPLEAMWPYSGGPSSRPFSAIQENWEPGQTPGSAVYLSLHIWETQKANIQSLVSQWGSFNKHGNSRLQENKIQNSGKRGECRAAFLRPFTSQRTAVARTKLVLHVLGKRAYSDYVVLWFFLWWGFKPVRTLVS